VTFGGVDPLLIDWATAQLGVRCSLDTPADLAAVAPLVQIQTVSGPSNDDNAGLIAANVSVDSFAADYASAMSLGWQVDHAFRHLLPGSSYGGVTFGKVRTLSIPSRRPWADVDVRRYGATYQVWRRAVHRRPDREPVAVAAGVQAVGVDRPFAAIITDQKKEFQVKFLENNPTCWGWPTGPVPRRPRPAPR
jgi:hypothetical protein